MWNNSDIPNDMTTKPESGVHKFVKLTAPVSSERFRQRFGPVYTKLNQLFSDGLIYSPAQRVILMLDGFKSDERISASRYADLLKELPENDRKPVDRLLQQRGIIEVTVVFSDAGFEDAGFKKDTHYTNQNLIDEIFGPSSRKSFDLAEPAAYSRRLPSETLYELLSVPGSIHSALVRILQVAATHDDAYHDKSAHGATEDCSEYFQRSRLERMKDAKTLASLIFTYASSPRATVRKRTKDLALNYSILFNRSDDQEALDLLRASLHNALLVVKSEDISALLERVDLVIKHRKTQKIMSDLDTVELKPETDEIEYVEVPWATHYKSKRKKA